jgi:hypothetical protein
MEVFLEMDYPSINQPDRRKIERLLEKERDLDPGTLITDCFQIEVHDLSTSSLQIPSVPFLISPNSGYDLQEGNVGQLTVNLQPHHKGVVFENWLNFTAWARSDPSKPGYLILVNTYSKRLEVHVL